MTKEEIKQVLEMASQIAYDWAINDLKRSVIAGDLQRLTEEKGGER